ncbi:MAG TPA: WecB/TagA/CpsF family glycosyltransferase [Clostridiales bacterium]|nr:WecB/TagA/CpsF family glycosyltransferase [Clostridiales bacterium]
MRNTIDILGIPVDNINMEKAMLIIRNFLVDGEVHTIYTPNSEIMMAAQRDKYLKDVLRQGDMLIADGAGVVLASKILGCKLPERVAGFDLVRNIFQISSETKLKFFLLGAKPGVAEEATVSIINRFKGAEISGYHHGYFSDEEEDGIINQINSSGAEILLVALGAPRQEKWIHENKNRLKVKICIGVGGTLDVFAGKVARAPEFFRKHNLEWLYRLHKEPWRFWRMLDIPQFLLLALHYRLFKSKTHNT